MIQPHAISDNSTILPVSSL